MTKSHLWHSRLTQEANQSAEERLPDKSSSRSRNLRNRSRLNKHLSIVAMKASLREAFHDSFVDKERCEVVSLKDSAEIDILRGEVLRSSRYSRVFHFGD